jgi:hypothetical protein
LIRHLVTSRNNTTYRRFRASLIAACLTGAACCSAIGEMAAADKPIHTWFHCHGEQSFADLEGHTDMVASVSMFGAPTAALVKQIREAGVETYRLVSGPAENIVPPLRERTIKGYLQDCQQLGFDGIDLDYESLPKSNRKAYSEFIRVLAGKLRAANKKLSICVAYTPQMQGDAPDPGFYDTKAIAAHCDLVRVMCYDKHLASKPGHGPTSTAPWAGEAARFWLRYIPREKLVIGLPAYSNDYDLRPGERGRQVPRDRPEISNDTKVERIWRPFEHIHVYRYLDEDGRPRVFYASDARSTAAHLETVKKLDVAGFGFWHHGSVSAEMWTAIRKSISKP